MMTPTRLRECIDTLGWSQRGLARALSRDEGMVRQWARGALPIPEDVAAWVETVAQFHERHPPPDRGARPTPDHRPDTASSHR